jgi:hypothetical protein
MYIDRTIGLADWPQTEVVGPADHHPIELFHDCLRILPGCVSPGLPEISRRGLAKIAPECARESGFDRKNFIRKLIRGIPAKHNSYNEFRRWLQKYKSQK